VRWEFRGEQVTITAPANPLGAYTVRFDTQARPRRFTMQGGPDGGQDGIYERHDNRLRIASVPTGAARPSSFDAAPQSGPYLVYELVPEAQALRRDPARDAENARVLSGARGQAARAISSNNLKQIGLALYSAGSDRGAALPRSTISGQDGKPLLSWRVAILPLFDYDLFKRFHLNEPWDSPHNRALVERMPKVFAPPAGVKTPEPGMTYYQALVGGGAAFEPDRPTTAEMMRDDTNSVLTVVEAAHPVVWTKPADLTFVPDGALPRLGGLFEDGFHAAFASGSVRFLPAGLDPQSLRA
jgi:hypothetical protein